MWTVWLALAIERERTGRRFPTVLAQVPPWWRWTLYLAAAINAHAMVDLIEQRGGVVRDSMLRGVTWT